MRKHRFLVIGCVLITAWVSACSERRPDGYHLSAKNSSQYIVNCRNDCSKLETTIRQNGGSVTGRYTNFNFLSYEIPNDKKSAINILSRYGAVKDRLLARPVPQEQHNLRLSDKPKITAISTSAFTKKPANYAFENTLNGSALLHEQNILGEGVVVAVIDSGIANNAEIVPTLSGNIIGGENFVPDAGEPSATSTQNEAHGTWVSTMIAAHASVSLDKDNELALAVGAYAPDTVIPVDETKVEIPMSGTAPAVRLYSLKTFGVNSPGAPSSRVIAAMDRVLTLKINFNNGMTSEPVAGDGTEENPFVYNSLDIKVLNMSLGGPALFPGAEIEDIVTDLLLQAGVVVVTAIGNEGPSAITGGAPGTAYSALTVGAASEPVHERILREIQLGEGKGILFRPLNEMLIAPFSSRGPTADGRIGIDLVANGVASFVQGPDGHISIVSGTSFAAPTVAGAAALLWQSFPDKTAREIRNALIEGANFSLIENTATPIDQGHGFLSVTNSFNLLLAEKVEPHVPATPMRGINSTVSETITQMGYDLIPASDINAIRRYILKPGEVKQLFIETDSNTEFLQMNLTHVLPFLPADKQNQLNGDNILLSLVDAPLSVDHSLLQDVFDQPKTFSFPNPQTGVLRLAIAGSRGNKGQVFVSLDIDKLTGQLPEPVASGSIRDNQTIEYRIDITDQTSVFNLVLQWNGNWSRYPAHDLDLVIIDPQGNIFFDAATLNSPEIIRFDTPAPGLWTILIEGFLLHEFSDEYKMFAFDQNNNPLLPTN